MKKFPRRTMCLSWSLAVLLLSSGFAQTGPGGVRGTARDQSGAVLIGATVVARHLQTNISTSVVSDEWGEYDLFQLEAGDYELQAVLPGFRSEVAGVTIVHGAVQILDFVLGIAPLSETVTVTLPVDRHV